MTSPPYYGTRSFGQGTWEGGVPDCTHKLLSSHEDGSHVPEGYRDACKRCGATRSASDVGLTLSLDAYLILLTGIFAEAHRVLKDDGTLWIVSGDTYSDGSAGLQSKNLYGAPWQLALALQKDGWILRSDIIWEQPSISLQSAPDRPTRSHDYVFLFSKQPQYRFNAAAIREPNAQKNGLRGSRTVWTFAGESYRTAGYDYPLFPQRLVARCILAGTNLDDVVLDPFCGAATASIVAMQLGRQSIGIELSPKYIEIAKHRIQATAKALDKVTTNGT